MFWHLLMNFTVVLACNSEQRVAPVIYEKISELHGVVGTTKKFYCVVVVILVDGQHLFPFTSDVVGIVPRRDVSNVDHETSSIYCLTCTVRHHMSGC
jgi:hypothetical protein